MEQSGHVETVVLMTLVIKRKIKHSNHNKSWLLSEKRAKIRHEKCPIFALIFKGKYR